MTRRKNFKVGFVLVMTKEVDLPTALRHTPWWLSICSSLYGEGFSPLLFSPSSQSSTQSKNPRLRKSDWKCFGEEVGGWGLVFKDQAWSISLMKWFSGSGTSLGSVAVTMNRWKSKCHLHLSSRAESTLHSCACIWHENSREKNANKKQGILMG